MLGMAATNTPKRTMSAAQIEAMFKIERQVMDLRTTGKSFYAINKQLGIQNSHQVFKRAISRDDNVEMRRAEALRLEEARLDALQEGIWGRAMAGEPRAVEVALKVLERRARLLGLDFADLISGKLIEVEEKKVMLMATALGDAVRMSGLSTEQAQLITSTFLRRVREIGEQKYIEAEVVEG